MKHKISESSLRHIIQEAIRRSLSEAESYGWVVETDEAQEAYDFACDRLGKEVVDGAIVRSLGDRQLSECLAYVFRMYDFDEWHSYRDGGEDKY